MEIHQLLDILLNLDIPQTQVILRLAKAMDRPLEAMHLLHQRSKLLLHMLLLCSMDQL
jgi:hypothetical protein